MRARVLVVAMTGLLVWSSMDGALAPAEPASPELRPTQLDSDTLPPYEALDAILEDYVEDCKSAEQIATARGFDLELVRRVLQMVERSEYKRQQAAPGLKISAKAFGVGRRLPIARKSEI